MYITHAPHTTHTTHTHTHPTHTHTPHTHTPHIHTHMQTHHTLTHTTYTHHTYTHTHTTHTHTTHAHHKHTTHTRTHTVHTPHTHTIHTHYRHTPHTPLEEESCSDHNIIKYNLKFNPDKTHKYNSQGPRFIIKENQHADFHKNFRRQILKNFQVGNNGGNISEIDERLAERLTSQEDVGIFIDRIDYTVRTTCTETFKHHISLKNYTKGK